MAREMAAQVFDFLKPVIETQKVHTAELADVKEIARRNGRSITRLEARVEFLFHTVERVGDVQAQHTDTLAHHSEMLTSHTEMLKQHGEMLSHHGVLLVRILSKLEDRPN